jgi:UDP-N-acetylmuramoylalanine--D-glutamate ligase
VAISKDLSSLNGVKVAVLGGGVSGSALARLACRMGARVLLSDARKISERTLSEMNEMGAECEVGHSDKILGCNFAVTSSGFPPNAGIIAKISEKGIPIFGELDFVSPCLKGKVVGITGSNGKTTTTSLLGRLLEFLNPMGKGVALTGNIGNPIADIAGIEYDYIIAELSSFQLHWAKNFPLDAAIVTNLAFDHIDWHGSFKNYLADKTKILSFVKGFKRETEKPETTAADAAFLTPETFGRFGALSWLDEESHGFAIIRNDDLSSLKPEGRVLSLEWDTVPSDDKIVLSSTDRRAYSFGDVLFEFDETTLLGRHNMENAAMAMAAVGELGFYVSSARKALKTFVSPPHRCSLVLSKDGVKYIDDSKGTNVAATVTALSSLEGGKIVILGGRGKGEDYGKLAAPLKKFAKFALLIGEVSGDIGKAIAAKGYSDFAIADGMEDAVRRACFIALPGDVVLLSPACTSWDSYKNYGERGDHFATLVREIVGGETNAGN